VEQSTAARWTPVGDIELNPRVCRPGTSPADPRLLGSIVHEVTHMGQGPALALTVEGEARA